MNKSAKQRSLENRILKRLKGVPLEAAKLLFADPSLQAIQEYANVVSIKRLGFNDHGPVHMRTAALNTITMFELLHDAGIEMNLEKEGVGTAEDSLTAVVLASLLHDLGMSVTRDTHEILSIQLALPYIDSILDQVIPANEHLRKTAIRSIAIEGIFGHMATRTIHSLEAGLVLIGDGSDMEKGRARIPAMLSAEPRVGDIHRTSASAIQKVKIIKGTEKPICIKVIMSNSVGFFQIEEVFSPKIGRAHV